MKKFLLFAFICAAVISKAQSYNMVPSGTVNTCAGNFYDSGGSASNYSSSINYTNTFHSPSGYRMQFYLNTCVLGLGDTLFIHDGISTAAPVMAVISGTVSGNPFYISSASNITFHFVSDGANVAAGWDFSISCITPAIVNVSPPAIKKGKLYTLAISGANTTFSINSPVKQASLVSGTDSIAGTAITNVGDTLLHVNFVMPCNVAAASYTLHTSGYGMGVVSLPNAVAVLAPGVAITPMDVSCNGACNGNANANPPVNANAPFSFSWSPAGGTAPNATGLCPGTYTVNVTDSAGCTFSQSVGINEPPPLGVSFSPVNVTCYGACNGAINSTPLGGVGPYLFSWSAGDTVPNIFSLCAGSYSVIVTDSHGCTAADSVNILEPAVLSAGIASQTNASCGMCDGSITGTATGGVSPYTFNWAPSGGTSITAGSLCVGNYTMTLTDANGCTTAATTNVTNVGGPTVTVSTANVTCNGGTNGSATANVSGGTAPYTYSWSPAGGSGPSATNLIAGSYTVTVTDASSCSGIASGTVSQPPALVASIAPPAQLNCTNASVILNGTGSSSGGGITYNWSTTGGNIVSGTTTNTAIIDVGASYTLTLTDTSGCFASTSVMVTANTTSPLAVISSSPSLTCSNSAVVIDASASSAGANIFYSWSGGNIVSGGNTNSPLVDAAGSYTLTVTDTSNGCTANTSATITSNTSAPFATITIPASVSCANPTIVLDATGSSSGGAIFYSWATTGGNIISGNTTNAATVNSAGSYSLTVTDTSNGCSAFDSVVVLSDLIPPNLSTTGTTFCSGTSGIISASSTTGGVMYNWNGPSSFASVIQNPSVTIGGTYTVIVTDPANGCTAVDSAVVTVNPLPVISITPSATNGCAPLCVSFSGSSSPASSSCNWSFTNGQTSSANCNPTICFVSPGLFGASLSVTDVNGCTDSLVQSGIITVNAVPTAGFSYTGVCTGLPTMFTNTSVNAVSYNWDFGDGNVSATQNPSNSYAAAGTYPVYLIATSAMGCTDSAQSVVSINSNADITGQLTYSGGNLTGANVFLISEGSTSALYDTIATTSSNGSGVYTFPATPVGNYYVRAEAIANPSLVNTYFDNQYLWDSAVVIIHGCTQHDTANITMVELPVLTGSGSINGVIYEGAGYGQKIIPGNPVPFTNVIPGVPVKVGRNPSGTIVASTVTDSSGAYHFTNLPVDNYRIYTDIPGYPMDSSYVVSITGTTTTVTNLDYIVDSNSVNVIIDVFIAEESKTNGVYTAFPNPTSGLVNIQFVNGNTTEVIRLFDLGGRLIYASKEISFQYNSIFHLDLNELGLSSGIYLLDLQNAGKKIKINFVKN